MTHTEALKQAYETAVEKVAADDFNYGLTEDIVQKVSELVGNSERNKGVITVLITLFSHKMIMPSQDIRYHQAKLENGFSGRNIDKAEVTPFLKSVSFPAMAESGWLTRSLEQPHPYTLDYPGAITPKSVKELFLSIIDSVQMQGVSAEKILVCLFTLLVKQRNDMRIELAKPHSLSIAKIVKVLKKHFTYQYSGSGASRLPTVAVYAAYQCMTAQVSRYKDKVLCPLEPHNSADAQSGRIGDIDVNNLDGSAFEGVEIKHEIVITRQLVADAYEKFKIHNTDRYYVLTTANMEVADWEGIESEIQKISQIHGCQVIVNGVYSSLEYYLRLLEDPAEFIDKNVELLKNDEAVKFQHKVAWNDIISMGI